jgi:exonuclease SbcC
MKLHRLSIDRMPGIDRPFELKALGEGLNIVVGPNGIGKSQVCAAVRALLWHERGIVENGLAASATFGHDGEAWSVVRDGSLHAWQREGIDVMAPVLPGERLEGCFFLGLRDLLDDSDRAGRDLAAEIRRQMSGGFDLEQVHQAFEDAVPVYGGRRENKDLAAAESEIRRAERDQADVERREGELESLESRAAEAGLASRRVVDVKAAIALQIVRNDLAAGRREIAALPQSLANLDGKEIARLDKIEEDLLRKRSEREDAAGALERSRSRAHATRLDEAIDPARIATWRERAEKLGEFERQLDAARIKRGAAIETLSQRRRWLGARAIPEAQLVLEDPLSPEEGSELFQFLRESQQLAAEMEAVQERLGLLAAREFSEQDARRLELLKRAVSPLREWLRAPDPERVHRSDGVSNLWPPRPVVLMVGGLLIVAGLLVEFFVSGLSGTGRGLAVIGLGVGLVGSTLLARVRIESEQDSQATDWRAIAEKRFPESEFESVEPPGTTWCVENVEARLQQLEDELSRLDGNEKRARDRLVERGQLEENLKGLERRSGDLGVRREALSERVGLEALRPDVELVDLAQGLAALREATVEARAAEESVKAFEESRNQLFEGLAAALARLGEAKGSDAASCRAAVHSLEERDRELRSAIGEGIREEGNRDRLIAEIARLEEGLVEIFSAAGMPDHDRLELTRMLGERPRYLELKARCADLQSRFDRATTDLAAAGESALAERSSAELADEQDRLERASEGRDELITRIAEIRKEARDAREGHVLEEAIARKGATLRSLRDRRDEALAALAGQFLVDGIRHEHETNQMPRVLARARDRFGVFTHHRYELKVAANDGGSFVAVDESGRGLRPEQLSDGTRAQLILAARLAFAEEAEQGADLPIFLDEAMDHSDPERFHAIACSLARMVMDDERQIFYLSNDPTDVERFRQAFEEVGCQRLQTIDLGEIRGQAARVAGPEALRVAPLAAVPSPEGLDAAGYGVLIGVRPLDPREDPGSQPLYYVLSQDLSLLHQLLIARIATVGQWTNLSEAGGDFAKEIVTGSPAGAQLADRIALLETFCLAWREGRGQKVGRPELEGSGAVSDKYLAALVEIAEESGGDARRLLAALRERKDARLSGYRSKATDDLERFFEERGTIDAKPVLDLREVLERAVGTPAANRLSPGVAAELVHGWWTLCREASPAR